MTRGEEIVASWGTDMKRAVCIEQIDAAIEARAKPLREALEYTKEMAISGFPSSWRDCIFGIASKALAADKEAV